MLESARRYSAPIAITAAFTAQIDLFEILAGSGRPLTLISFEFGQPTEIGDAQEEELTLILKRVTSAATSGTGGAASTARPLLPNDAAATAAIEVGNATKLTGGTSEEMARFQWNVRQPAIYVPTPEERITLSAGAYLVLELATTPADSIGGINGRLTFAELV